MAEFKPFNLASVMMAGESIKGMRQQRERNALLMKEDSATARINGLVRLGGVAQAALQAQQSGQSPAAVLRQNATFIRDMAPMEYEELAQTFGEDFSGLDDNEASKLSLYMRTQLAEMAKNGPPEIKQILEAAGDNGAEFTAVMDNGATKPLGIQPSASSAKAPETRNRYEGGTLIQEQWNPQTRKFEEVGRGPRYKQDTNITQIVNPILMKLANGEPVSEGEQHVLDIYTRADYLDRLIRGAYEGGGASPTGSPSGPRPGLEPVSAAEAHSPPSSTPRQPVGNGRQKAQLLKEARVAIDRGADRRAVEQRLEEMGINPKLLNAVPSGSQR